MNDQTDKIPNQFDVAVLLQRKPAISQWVDWAWQAIGITVGRQPPTADGEPRLVRSDGDVSLYLVGGLVVSLFVDECESYYYNLVSDTPKAYVLAHLTDTGATPVPFRVSMSFDEAHAYLEGDDEIYAVEVPPELYRLTEQFVIEHYFPERKYKRKLRDWSASEDGDRPA